MQQSKYQTIWKVRNSDLVASASGDVRAVDRVADWGDKLISDSVSAVSTVSRTLV
jgi:hypothetical protein